MRLGVILFPAPACNLPGHHITSWHAYSDPPFAEPLSRLFPTRASAPINAWLLAAVGVRLRAPVCQTKAAPPGTTPPPAWRPPVMGARRLLCHLARRQVSQQRSAQRQSRRRRLSSLWQL